MLSYEEKRQKAIEEKNAFLRSLELETAPAERPTKRVKTEKIKKETPAPPSRRSARQQNLDPEGRNVPDQKAAREELEKITEEKMKRREAAVIDLKELMDEKEEEEQRLEMLQTWNFDEGIASKSSTTQWKTPYDVTFKVIKERIISLAVDESRLDVLAFFGDKVGSLAAISFSESNGEWQEPTIMQSVALHRGGVTCIKIATDNVYTSSYDGSIREFNIPTQQFKSVVGDDYRIVNFTLANNDLWFSTSDAELVHVDLREGKERVYIGCHEKKIGHVALNPVNSLLGTASLDRTVKLWDLRKMNTKKPIWKYEHGKSATSINFNPSGTHFVTTSYDDTLCLFESDSNPTKIASIPHLNQTGKWVTPFRAVIGANNLVTCGNMKRGVDLYDLRGTRVGELKSDSFSAIPACNAWHNGLNILVSGNASGRCGIWV
jgi:WD40 repeat protein